MANTDNKVCKFNCICNRDDCSFRHYLTDPVDRKSFKEILDANYDKSRHNETDPSGIRRRVCFYGHLCGKDDCGFQHFCNVEGRKVLQKIWWKQGRKNEALAFIDHLNEKYALDDGDVEKLKGLIGIKK